MAVGRPVRSFSLNVSDQWHMPSCACFADGTLSCAVLAPETLTGTWREVDVPPCAEVDVGLGFACSRSRAGEVDCFTLEESLPEWGLPDERFRPRRVAGLRALPGIHVGRGSLCGADAHGRFCVDRIAAERTLGCDEHHLMQGWNELVDGDPASPALEVPIRRLGPTDPETDEVVCRPDGAGVRCVGGCLDRDGVTWRPDERVLEEGLAVPTGRVRQISPSVGGLYGRTDLGEIWYWPLDADGVRSSVPTVVATAVDDFSVLELGVCVLRGEELTCSKSPGAPWVGVDLVYDFLPR